MQRGAARLTVTALLIVGGILAASFLWIVERQSDVSAATQVDISVRLTHMGETIAGIGAGQRSYVAPGQLDEPWFEEVSALLDQLSIEIQQVSNTLRSPDATPAIQTLSESADALIAADARTRQNLEIGQDLMASDVIFSDGHNIIDTMTASLRDLQTAEQQVYQARLASLTRQRWATFGATAILWIIGLLALAKPPAVPPATVAEPTQARPSERKEPLEADGSHVEQGPSPSLDLTLVADLCTNLSRVTSPSALPELLGHAARILDASGVILWVSAGKQLFPVMGHGYPPDVLTRMAPIEREENNATAAAWRTGQLTVVRSTTPSDNGAIVAPLFGLDECVGVLAAEVRHGSEDRPEAQAFATVIAAQLATIVPAWPSDSLTNPGDSANAKPNLDDPTSPQTSTLEVRSA